MSGMLGVAAHRIVPQGQKIGAVFWHNGEKFYVTQAEIDRIKNMPSAEKVREYVAAVEAMLNPTPPAGVERADDNERSGE